MTANVKCPRDHIAVLHPHHVALAWFGDDGWHIVNVCPRCSMRTYTSITDAKAAELHTAGAGVLDGLTLNNLRNGRARNRHGELTDFQVRVWANLVTGDTSDDILRAWVNTAVTS